MAGRLSRGQGPYRGWDWKVRFGSWRKKKKPNPRMSHSRMEILREMGSRSRRNRGEWRGESKRPAHGSGPEEAKILREVGLKFIEEASPGGDSAEAKGPEGNTQRGSHGGAEEPLTSPVSLPSTLRWQPH